MVIANVAVLILLLFTLPSNNRRRDCPREVDGLNTQRLLTFRGGKKTDQIPRPGDYRTSGNRTYLFDLTRVERRIWFSGFAVPLISNIVLFTLMLISSQKLNMGRALFVLVMSSLALPIVMITPFADVGEDGRLSAFGLNPNFSAILLSLPSYTSLLHLVIIAIFGKGLACFAYRLLHYSVYWEREPDLDY